MRISDWSSDVCSSDLGFLDHLRPEVQLGARELRELVGPHVGGLSAAALGAGLEIVALDRRLRRGAQGRDRALGRSGRRVEAEPGLELERSEEHTTELQTLMRISYAVFCLKTKNKTTVK